MTAGLARVNLLWIIGVIVVGVMGYRMMEMHSLESLGESNETPSLAEVQRLAGLQIPEGATQLQARVDLVITKRTLYLRFSIAPDQLDALLAKLQMEQFSGTEIPNDLLSSERPQWFTPNSAQRYRAGEKQRRAVLVDETDPSRYTVYLKARA